MSYLDITSDLAYNEKCIGTLESGKDLFDRGVFDGFGNSLGSSKGAMIGHSTARTVYYLSLPLLPLL